MTKEEVKKGSVVCLVEMLVTWLFKRSEVVQTVINEKNVIKRLAEKIWTQVEASDFTITPETFKNLHKVVYKPLRKKWGCAHMVLVYLSLGETTMEEYIANVYKAHLKGRKRNAFCRFFTSIGRGISNICRRRNGAGVI